MLGTHNYIPSDTDFVKVGSVREDEQLDFRISSGLKEIIGKELINDDFIAIFELVKNSYDANASTVTIVFQNIMSQDASRVSKILVIDDGHGMSYDDLVNKWLFVGFSDKKLIQDPQGHDYRNGIKKHRRIFSGAKGIGRFSTDRLSKQLKLYTKKEGEEHIHSLNVDWTEFDKNQSHEFQTIKAGYSKSKHIMVKDYSMENFRKGTILELSSLNDKWDREKLLRLKHYLQRLVNPSEVGVQNFRIVLVAKEFRLEDQKKKDYEVINGPIKNIVFEKLKIKTTQIKCSVRGDKVLTEILDKGKFIFRLEEKNKFVKLQDIIVHVFYLNREAKSAFTRIMGIETKNYGSVFLYKNGFRIHPYGDLGDDWLQLETRRAQGYHRYLSTRELMGRVEIYGMQPDFKEVSSRDGGVIKTEAYRQLKALIINNVVRRLERYVVEGIGWDTEGSKKEMKSPEQTRRDSLELIQKIVGQVKDPDKNIVFNKDLLNIFEEKQVEKLPELIKNVESLTQYVRSPKEKGYIEIQMRSLKLAAKSLERDKREKEEELTATKKESIFLKKSMSLDKMALTLLHTIDISTRLTRNFVDEINTGIKNERPLDEIAVLVDKVDRENQKIRAFSSIVGVANFDLKVEKITKNIVLYITQYVETILGNPPRGLGCKFHNSNIDFVTDFSPLEISIMIDNFISNSVKAEASFITFDFRVVRNNLHVLVADNGKGVSEKAGRFLFTRGFTTTRGSGLGLCHIKTIAESIGGSMRFLYNNFEGLGQGACFEVILKRARN